MITFFRTAGCKECDWIEEELERHSLAHTVVDLSDAREERRPPEGSSPPVLVDDNRTYQGYEAVKERIEELAAIKKEWDKYQSDACYGGEDE